MLESQPRRSVTAHAEPFENAALSRGQRTECLVHIRDSLRDEDRLDRGRPVLRVGPKATAQTIHEHHDHRWRLARYDRFVEDLGQRTNADNPSIRPVQPVKHRQAGFRLAVGLGGVDVVAHLPADGLAVECLRSAARSKPTIHAAGRRRESVARLGSPLLGAIRGGPLEPAAAGHPSKSDGYRLRNRLGDDPKPGPMPAENPKPASAPTGNRRPKPATDADDVTDQTATT